MIYVRTAVMWFYIWNNSSSAPYYDGAGINQWATREVFVDGKLQSRRVSSPSLNVSGMRTQIIGLENKSAITAILRSLRDNWMEIIAASSAASAVNPVLCSKFCSSQDNDCALHYLPREKFLMHLTFTSNKICIETLNMQRSLLNTSPLLNCLLFSK